MEVIGKFQSRIQKIIFQTIFILLLSFLVLPAQALDKAQLAGSWRIYSQRIFYDKGGGGSWDAFHGRNLVLTKNGKWQFGPSSGKFFVQPIQETDWKKWGIEPYGPTLKLVLAGWSGIGTAGPIEISNDRVDFLWAIYPVKPPLVTSPGTMWIKFGH